MVQRRLARLGVVAAFRYRRPLLRLVKAAAGRPQRTATVLNNGRRLRATAKQLRANPKAQRHAREAARAARRAVTKGRKLGVSRAVTDQGFLNDLRAAAGAMSRGVAAAQTPPPRRGRAARLVFGVGMVGAGAYAGYRAYRAQPATHGLTPAPDGGAVGHTHRPEGPDPADTPPA